jgi:hypothetical protein
MAIPDNKVEATGLGFLVLDSGRRIVHDYQFNPTADESEVLVDDTWRCGTSLIPKSVDGGLAICVGRMEHLSMKVDANGYGAIELGSS